MIAEFNSFRASGFGSTRSMGLGAYRESPVRARNRSSALDVALRLHVYYHDDPDPGALAGDWATLREFINSYDLNKLAQGNSHTFDPQPVMFSGSFDPATKKASIQGRCPYTYSRPGSFGPFVGFHGSGNLAISAAMVSRVVDFNSRRTATDMMMQVGRYVFDYGSVAEPTDWVERTYAGAAPYLRDGPPEDWVGTDFFYAQPITHVSDPFGPVIETAFDDSHNFESFPFLAVLGRVPISDGIVTAPTETVTVTARVGGEFTVLRDGSPLDVSGPGWYLQVHVTAPAYQPGGSIGCIIPSPYGDPLIETAKSGGFVKIRVPDLGWPAPVEWPPNPPFGDAEDPDWLSGAKRISYGYITVATLS